MNKVFWYECKRILFSRVYLILLICNFVYAWIWLKNEALYGIGGTAPFSGWTCMAYFGAVLPAAIVTVLLMQAEHFSRRQKQTDILLLASPVTSGKLGLLRCGGLAVCFLGILLPEFILYAGFCIRYFGETGFVRYLLPVLLLAISCFLAAAGLGTLLGSVRSWLVYVLAGGLFCLGLLSVNTPFSWFCGSYFKSYPLSLPPGADGEPAFRTEPLWLLARCLYLTAGVLLLLLHLRRKPKPDKA